MAVATRVAAGIIRARIVLDPYRSFFGLDVVISAIALLVFMFAERKTAVVRYLWLPVVATLVVGVSLGLPLFLYMRQRARDASTI